MNKIEKLLRKISQSDRKRLLDLIECLIKNNYQGLNISKIKNSDFFRLKSGRYQIIFHKEQQEIIIDSIKLRNKKIYQGL